MIGRDFKNLEHSEEALRTFCDKYSREEISTFLARQSGQYLGNNHMGATTPATSGGIPDIRRIYGAGLKILSGEGYHASEQTKFYAGIVLSQVYRDGFTMYNQKEALIAYYCVKQCI